MSRSSLTIFLCFIASAATLAAQSRSDSRSSSLFRAAEPLELKLEAPLEQLFDRGKDNEEYNVNGTLTVLKLSSGAGTVAANVEVSVRGNTSKRETECPFPKLRLKFKEDDRLKGSALENLGSLKIGTHCGERPEDERTPRFGRLANEQSPWREALVYRLVAAIGSPTLEARPARITYVDTGSSNHQALTRNALLLEDEDAAKKRLDATGEIEEKEFGTAHDQFAPIDAARLAFAEALIGNFDWCLRFSSTDRYRCDQRHPLWNILTLTRGDAAFPVIRDFDLAGPVTGPHPWFAKVYNEAFAPSRSRIEVEVLSQVQRTRTLFPRDVLDSTRRDLLAHKSAAEQAIRDAVVDERGRALAREYVDHFFRAIGTDDAFYIPVVAKDGIRVYVDAERSKEACVPDDVVPVGTPVKELQRAGAMAQVLLLDAMWKWGPPHGCDAVRQGPVWIDAAISPDYPPRGER